MKAKKLLNRKASPPQVQTDSSTFNFSLVMAERIDSNDRT